MDIECIFAWSPPKKFGEYLDSVQASPLPEDLVAVSSSFFRIHGTGFENGVE
jgi:hypothetical protein